MKEKEKKDNKKKSWLGYLKDIWKHPRGKAILFFAGYCIFFIILIGSLRSNRGSTSSNSIENNLNNQVSVHYKLDGIASGNYYFSRTETVNGITTIFEGKSNNNRSEVLMSKNNTLTNYFMYGGIVIQKIDGIYKVSTQPYTYPNVSVYKYIQAILNQATLISKTDYSVGNTIYYYQISTTTLAKILDQQVVDLEDIPNTIEVETDQNQNVIAITYQLDAYASYYQKTPTTLQIKLAYSNFGQVETLEIPES